MLSRSQKRVVLVTVILIVVVLFVVPAINVNRYRLSVAESLSRALGREVTVQGISIQTFPQPGFLLTGVSVADDPSISAEPMLRADEVLATLRFTSLWRGRLEISNLKLQYPSLNLARSNDGRWNLESLLEKARQAPAAPTAKTRPELRARFPYIECNGGRINLKIGNEKKVFALSDADFALWLASEDEWRMRLEARPIRTDANLSDTGTLKMEGSWRRASELHETPIFARLWWDYGQLGQMTRLIYGRDRGWRGGITASAVVSGKPENLQIKLDTRVNDFRRYDIASSDSVNLEAHCNTAYDFTEKRIRDLACQLPAGGGVILVHGNYAFPPSQDLDLSVSAENVPAQFLFALARHAKRDLPSDARATGMVSAVLTARRNGDQSSWAGDGQTSPIEIRSSVLNKPLQLEPTRWSLVGPGTAIPAEKKSKHRSDNLVPEQPAVLAWKFQPVNLAIGGTTPAALSGWFSNQGYEIALQGETELPALFELAKLTGLPTPASDLTGRANGKLQIKGEWANFTPANFTADAQLKNVAARISGVARPLVISVARFQADGQRLELSKATAKFEGHNTNFDFNASWPERCGNADRPPCTLDFSASADQIKIDELNSLLNPRAQKQPWYSALANTVIGAQRKSFPEIHATGKITSAKLLLKSVPLSHFTCTLDLKPGEFRLDGISAEVFGGKYSGTLAAKLSGDSPLYVIAGTLQRVSMPNLASAMKDSWATGVLNSRFTAETSGWNAEAILSSATASGTFDWQNGALLHIDLEGHGKPLQFSNFSGTLTLKSGLLTLSEGKLQNPKSIYRVGGTASLDRKIKFTLARDGAPEVSVTGSLERPTVAPSKGTPTQVALRRNR
jgi:hypothetical protein